MMRVLDQPLAKYVRGCYPSHCGTQQLTEAFNLPAQTTETVLDALGFVHHGKPTKAALEAGVLDRHQGHVLWNIQAVLDAITPSIPGAGRVPMNQELPNVEEGHFTSASTIGTYFNVSGKKIGQWLREEGIQQRNGKPTRESIKTKLAEVVTASTAGGKTEAYLWDLRRTLELLQSAGHLFDYDYEKTLKGRGKNSDVRVTTLEGRAAELAQEFQESVTSSNKNKCAHIIKNAPAKLLRSIEAKLQYPPGFLSEPDCLVKLF